MRYQFAEEKGFGAQSKVNRNVESVPGRSYRKHDPPGFLNTNSVQVGNLSYNLVNDMSNTLFKIMSLNCFGVVSMRHQKSIFFLDNFSKNKI